MGNGGLSVDQAIELFSKESPERKLDLIYELIHNQNCTCNSRPKMCDEKYMPKTWFKTKITALAGFSAGLGISVEKIYRFFGG